LNRASNPPGREICPAGPYPTSGRPSGNPLCEPTLPPHFRRGIRHRTNPAIHAGSVGGRPSGPLCRPARSLPRKNRDKTGCRATLLKTLRRCVRPPLPTPLHLLRLARKQSHHPGHPPRKHGSRPTAWRTSRGIRSLGKWKIENAESKDPSQNLLPFYSTFLKTASCQLQTFSFSAFSFSVIDALAPASSALRAILQIFYPASARWHVFRFSLLPLFRAKNSSHRRSRISRVGSRPATSFRGHSVTVVDNLRNSAYANV